MRHAKTQGHSLRMLHMRVLRSFTVSLSCNAGPARGQGRGSFVDTVLTAVDKFYSEVVQHIKPWVPAPPEGQGKRGCDARRANSRG